VGVVCQCQGEKQWNDSDMLSVISQAKVFVESQALKSVNCVQKNSAWVLIKL
jgi:hypothetical protein